MERRIRLGFAVRALGGPRAGGRRGRHLSLALAALSDMLGYLRRIEVGFYRTALELCPGDAFVQLGECAAQIDALVTPVAQAGLRLGIHLPLGMAFAGVDEVEAAKGLVVVEATAALLEQLDGGHTPMPSTMVTHLGAAPNSGALERFAVRYLALSARARTRLTVEHESAGPSLGQLLALHQRCGVPVVLDTLHLELHNPERLPLDLALGLALATWPPGSRAEVHLSSHRSEAHLAPGKAGGAPMVLPPRPGQHADFVATGDLERLLLAARGLPPFDIMLEAKAGDLALLRLRSELAGRSPDLAAQLGRPAVL